MTVYSQKFPGLVQICPECGALLGYNSKDIYENTYIYCPICRTKINIHMEEAKEIVKDDGKQSV